MASRLGPGDVPSLADVGSGSTNRRRDHRVLVCAADQAMAPVDQLGDQGGPSGLVAGPEARTVVAVEVFIKRNVVAPVGIGLKEPRPAQDRALAGRVAEKDPRQAAGDFGGGLIEGGLVSTSSVAARRSESSRSSDGIPAAPRSSGS